MIRSGFSHVRVHNFQSVAEADVPLGPLTVVVGDNTAGKSALLRAIEAACFNETGVSFITSGEDKTEVELTLSEDGKNTHRLLWRKKREGGATYDLETNDGYMSQGLDRKQHFGKLGAAVPPEVRKALGIVEIDVDKTLTIMPQVHHQGEFAFLIDRSEGQAARALAKMTKLDVVVEAQGLIRADLRRANAELKATADNITNYEQQLGEFEGLDVEVARVEQVLERVADLETQAHTVAEKSRAYATYTAAKTKLADIGDVPANEVVTRLTQTFNDVLVKTKAQREWQAAIDELNALPDVLPEVPDLTAQLERLTAMRAAYGEYTTASQAASEAALVVDDSEKEYREAVEAYNAIGTCPECGQPLEKVTT